MLEDVQEAHTKVIKVMAKAVLQTKMLVLSFFLSRVNEMQYSPGSVCACVYSVQQTFFQSPNPMRQTCCCPHLHTRFQMQLPPQDAPLSQGDSSVCGATCAVRGDDNNPFYRPTVNVEGVWAKPEKTREGVWRMSVIKRGR